MCCVSSCSVCRCSLFVVCYWLLVVVCCGLFDCCLWLALVVVCGLLFVFVSVLVVCLVFVAVCRLFVV